VDEPPISEILPGLYRVVLDAVADLEARGRRREAAEIRADATRVYSRAWNAAAAHRLRALRLRADRIGDAPAAAGMKPCSRRSGGGPTWSARPPERRSG
jgi:hypothetical protein